MSDSPERAAYKREWERNAYRTRPDLHGTCVECGGLLGTWRRKKATSTCAGCLGRRRETRWRRIETMWAEGWLMREIADELGWSMNHLRAEFGRMRKAGRLPLRYRTEEGKRVWA